MRKYKEVELDIHADDYAVSMHASEDLIQLLQEQKLDSISIIPNMSCYEACMKKLHEAWDSIPVKPLISVHMNLMEGHSVCDPSQLSQLVDDRGYFKCSWGSLLLGSYQMGKRKELQNEIALELAAQINRIKADLPEGCALRLDSHQHTHMIPVVRDAMLQVIDSLHGEVTFVRDSREPLRPFLAEKRFIPSYGVANLIKNVLLNIYATSIERELQKRSIATSLLWGLNMSGHMDIQRIRGIFPGMMQYFADHEKKVIQEIGNNPSMEILFHPGTVLPDEIGDEYVKEGFVEFHLSEGRKIERQAVDCLSEVIHE